MSPQQPETLHDAGRIQEMLERMSADIEAHAADAAELGLVAIRRGGEEIATRLAQDLARRLGLTPKLGAIDITLYRDDWTTRTKRPVVRRTEIPFAVDDRQIVLVDDVLFTGRTVRAALDELMDFGRPRSVRLAVLIDRGGRELPIQPDVAGEKVACRPGEVIDVVLSGNNPALDKVIRRKMP